MSNEHAEHVVVFDVNVWLDIARIFGPHGFSWDAMTEFVVGHAREPVPSRTVAGLDSALAISLCRDGKFPGGAPLEVWTSPHLDDTLLHKLTQPLQASRPEDAGLGWASPDALSFLSNGSDELVWAMTEGTTTGEIERAEQTPPLDHEDGKVYLSALRAGDEPVVRYLVTNDRGFREANLRGSVARLFPYEWVQLVRRSQQRVALRKLRPPVR
ncbi:MAG: hypothetical protein WA966_05825 [Ornithinimicrobium sp.]